jgi:apolipoprotein N-acyltransferase
VKARVFAPAVASAVLLWLAFFPLNAGPLGFVALVPWLTLARADVSNRHRYLAAYLGGAVFFALATKWVTVAHSMMMYSWFGFIVVMPVTWVLALWLIRKFDALKVPLAVAVPVAWVALEYARMHFPTGFPILKPLGMYHMIGFGWYFLGYTQHAFVPLIQIADFGGVYAVSFVVAACNGAVAELVLRVPRVRAALNCKPASASRARSAFGPAFALALVAAACGYGAFRLAHEPFAAGPTVAALQGSVSQGVKMDRGGGLKEQYTRAFGLAYHTNPDLIVWPETCYWEDWYDLAPGVRLDSVPNELRAKFVAADEQFRRKWAANVLFGLSGHEWDGAKLWKYNSALLVRPQSADPVRYDKMHLVPFGEYVPLGEILPFMQVFTPYKNEYSCRPGENWSRFPLIARDGRAFTFGCLICYEDTDPYLARQYVAREPVNFLVNISNDGWFDGTEEHEQHLAVCRFRAIEARRAVVRAVNTGVSAVIDPDGRVIALPREIVGDRLSAEELRGWRESRSVEGVVTAAVPLDSRAPLYATLGDWLPASCWALALVALVAARVRRMRTGERHP